MPTGQNAFMSLLTIHRSHKRVFSTIQVSLLIILTFGCSNATAQQSPIKVLKTDTSAAATSTSIPTALPTQTVTITASPKPIKEQAIPTSTAVSDGDVTWAVQENLKMVDGLFDFGLWSPTRNEIVFTSAHLEDITLTRFTAPDFQPQEIRIPFSNPNFSIDNCGCSDILWSQDGQKIYFGGPVSDSVQAYMEDCSLWVLGHDSLNPSRVNRELHGRSLELGGWLDPHTIYTASYRGGIQLIDLPTGKIINRAYTRESGNSFFAKDFFVSTNNYYSGPPFTMFAFGRHAGPIDLTTSVDLIGLQYTRLPPVPEIANTFLTDVIPNTNKALGYWYQEVDDTTASGELKISYIHKLVLWDIDANTVTTLVPYALYGRFNPDLHSLAYLTNGPAKLDSTHHPIEVTSGNARDLRGGFGLDIEDPYLQLLDLGAQTVFLSVPVQALSDDISPDFYHVAMEFSLDGRYLAFVSDRKLDLDETGWPRMIQTAQANPNHYYLHILDLKKRKLIWSRAEPGQLPKVPNYDTNYSQGLPTWSLQGNQFTFLDAQNNIQLVNLEKGTTIPITLEVHGKPCVQWSPDGAYIVIEIPNPDYHWKIAFLEIP